MTGSRGVHERDSAAGRWGIWGVLALVFIVCGLYLPSLSSGFLYDDQVLIVDAPARASALELFSIFREPHHTANLPYYRPIPRFSMAVQKFAYGNDPLPFHAFNVALIGAVALAALALLRSRGFRSQPVPALLGAALIALHPATSSAVYAITGRETLLLAMFSMAAVAAFLRSGRGWYAAALLLLAGALLSKEQAVMIPAVFVWADLLKLSNDPPGTDPRRWVRRYLPVGALVLLYLACRSQILTGPSPRLALWEAPAGPLFSALHVLQTLFVPFVELVYEPSGPEVWWSGWRLAGVVLATASLTVVAVRKWGEVAGPVLFGLGWCVLMNLPIANVFVQEAKFAERYALMALPGLVGIALALLSDPRRRAGARPSVLAGSLAWIVSLGVISVGRAETFSTERVFLNQWVSTSPRSAQAQAALGQHWLRIERFERAIEPYRRAKELLPEVAERHFALGNALRLAGRSDEALEEYQHALRIDPDHLGAQLNLGRILRRDGRLNEAASLYESWLERNPDDEQIQRRLDQVRMEQRRMERSQTGRDRRVTP